MNKNIVNIFDKLITHYNQEIQKLKKAEAASNKITPLSFKIRNFVKVKKIIDSYPHKITSGEELKEIKGIGKGVIDRVNEILATGTLKEIPLTLIQNNNQNKLKEELLTITGIGNSKSTALLAKNITLDKLKNELSKIEGNIDDIPEDSILQELTHHQLIGLKYLDHINTRIPRAEIIKIEIKLKKHISTIDDKLEVIICGSFRRQAATSGDIDMLVLHQDLQNKTDIENHPINFLPEIVKLLESKGLLVAHLTEDGNTKYMGLCKLTKKSKARRIDIRFIPYESRAAAILYFTGSGSFNQKMRSEALKKNYTINEYGIYKLNTTGGKKTKGAMVPTQEEKDIFDVIKKPFVEPQDRK